MLIVLSGLKPSLERPNLTLQVSLVKSECNESKSFQASPSVGCLKFSSLSRSVSCHLIATDVLEHMNVL